MTRIRWTYTDWIAAKLTPDAFIAINLGHVAFTAWLTEREYQRDWKLFRSRPFGGARNAVRSQVQCMLFIDEPLKYGKSYTAYVADKPERAAITTWMGDTLAGLLTYTTYNYVSRYKTNGQGSFTAIGIDGRLYRGRHNGKGMHCRMRLCATQPSRIQVREMLRQAKYTPAAIDKLAPLDPVAD